MMPLRRSARHGFTLLELTMVLGIISLLAGVGISMASGAIKAADRITTQERLSTIKLALDSFGKTYGHLPCPADRSLVSSSASFGVEGRNPVALTSCLSNGTAMQKVGVIFFGAVPVRTLGLPDSYEADAWGNKFTYAVGEIMKTEPTAYKYMSGLITVRAGTRTSAYDVTSQRVLDTVTAVANNGGGAARVTVAGASPATGTIVHMNGAVYKGSYSATKIDATHFDLFGSTYSATDTGTVEWLLPGPGAAYVVVSHGPDGRGAYPVNASSVPANKLCNSSATANTSPAPCTSNANQNCIDIENCNDDNIFYDSIYNDGTQDLVYFDDYIVYGSNWQQRNEVAPNLYSACPVGAGNCENWCATCAVNYPGGGATAPPAAITANTAFLYKKVLTSDSTTCTATCFWGGPNAGVFTRP